MNLNLYLLFFSLLLFSNVSYSEDPLAGACPRLERTKIGLCYEAISGQCQDVTECICRYCDGPPTRGYINQVKYKCDLWGQCAPPPREGQIIPCQRPCILPTTVCEQIPVECQNVKLQVNTGVFIDCENPLCPPCPPKPPLVLCTGRTCSERSCPTR